MSKQDTDTAKANRVRLHAFIEQGTKQKLLTMKQDGVARSEGAVVDLAVDDLHKKQQRKAKARK